MSPDSLTDRLERERARLAALDEERDRVRRRIERLRAAAANDARPVSSLRDTIDAPKTSREKVALFRRLFRGRTDVFPTRWVNRRRGTAGYSPACANEWVRGTCGKPRVKCRECPNQAFLEVTDRVIVDHFRGRHVAGVYPLLADDTCWFLAADFDGASWHEDVPAFAETCRDHGLPVAVERSRSGDGAHVWFFFEAPVSARDARQLGSRLLTETMSRHHTLSFESYDRLFPNQDLLPRGGFGNLIALPFQDGARQRGNSVFVDDHWAPHPDQWAYLASVRRIDPSEVKMLARGSEANGTDVGTCLSGDAAESAPWDRRPSRRVAEAVVDEPLPGRIRSVLAQSLFVEKAGLPSALLDRIQRLAAFQNPTYHRRQAMRLSTARTPRFIACAEELPHHVALPRGCVDALRELLAAHGAELLVDDRRTDGDPIDVRFEGVLTPSQATSVDDLLAHETGVFVAPPGSGKTVVGAHLIARRARNALVLVHRTPLLDQWIAQLATFTSLSTDEIGRVGGGKRRPGGLVDVAMIQSLAKRGAVDDLVARYGHIVVDECHHVPAVSFERILREAKARFVTGLTATPRRRDGHHPIIHLQLGPIRHSIDSRAHASQRAFDHCVIVRETAFRPSSATTSRIQDVYRELAADDERNELILDDVIGALEQGRSPLLLTERRDHVAYFANRLDGVARNLIVLRGGMRTKERRSTMERLARIPEDEERLVVATGRYVGEGFDDARLDTLFLALPISWRGTLEQYAGRLHRRHRAKRDVRIVDYVDRAIPMLGRMFAKRERGYRAMGYERCDELAPARDVRDLVIEYDKGP